uniref:G protein-coupled receptor n=1 Tax=Pristionchus pacificus TaxID=54126 RepID=A0A8R1UT70_PRIPA
MRVGFGPNLADSGALISGPGNFRRVNQNPSYWAKYQHMNITPVILGWVAKKPSVPPSQKRQGLEWLRSVDNVRIIVFGEVGNCGIYRYGNQLDLFAAIALILPIRYLLIGTSVRLLHQQSASTTRAVKMRKLYISVLLRQTSILSFLLVYPLLLTIIAFQYQIDFLPDALLACLRIGVVVAHMSQSIPQFCVLISANKSFQKVGEDVGRRLKPGQRRREEMQQPARGTRRLPCPPSPAHIFTKVLRYSLLF